MWIFVSINQALLETVKHIQLLTILLAILYAPKHPQTFENYQQNFF